MLVVVIRAYGVGLLQHGLRMSMVDSLPYFVLVSSSECFDLVNLVCFALPACLFAFGIVASFMTLCHLSYRVPYFFLAHLVFLRIADNLLLQPSTPAGSAWGWEMREECRALRLCLRCKSDRYMLVSRDGGRGGYISNFTNRSSSSSCARE